MRVACHQPVYFARLHLLHRWLHVDRLVWLRNVQFARKSPDEHGVQHPTGQQTTDVCLGQASVRITVPISGSREPIARVQLADEDWPKRHLETLRHGYGKLHWAEYESSLTELLTRSYASLADLNVATFDWLCNAMGVTGPEQLVDDGMTCYGSERIVECCKRAEASVYVAGRPSIAAYLDGQAFAENGIRLEAQEWLAPFRNLSGLDLVLSVGGRKARELLEAE